jgi:hypothetical protein
VGVDGTRDTVLHLGVQLREHIPCGEEENQLQNLTVHSDLSVLPKSGREASIPWPALKPKRTVSIGSVITCPKMFETWFRLQLEKNMN